MDLGSIARSAARAQQLRQNRSLSSHNPAWSASEDEALRKHYPDRKALRRALPNRTLLAARWRAGILGIRTPQAQWLASEVSTLRRLYCGGVAREEIMKALPRFSWQKIRAQAANRRFRRPPRTLLHQCHPIINQIKARARELNMSMHDVDELAHSGKYFVRASWLNTQLPNPKWVSAAVHALDGEVLAKWKE